MNNRKSIAILFVFVMLLQPLMTPTGELNQKNTLEVDARSTLPDLMVVDVTTILGGGVFSSGTNKLAIGTHQVSVNITNQGLTTAQSTLMVNYVPLGLPAVNVATVTVELDPFEFETHTITHTISTLGPGQRYVVTLTEPSNGDADMGNNFKDLEFDVETLEEGEHLSNDLPEPAFPPPRLALGMTTFEAVARNAGNVGVTATFRN